MERGMSNRMIQQQQQQLDPNSTQIMDDIHRHHQLHQHQQPQSNEDFIDQILSTIPNCSWPPHPNDIKTHPGTNVERSSTAPPGAFHYPFDDPGFGAAAANGFAGGPGAGAGAAIHNGNGNGSPFPPPPAPQNYGGGGGAAAPASASTGGSSGATPQKQSRVRARRGQATDPHSIAERLRRERIAERMKALQELVPNANKTDKASMLDEIIDYVKFLQLQVKIVSMSRLGGVAGMNPLVADMSGEGGGIRRNNNGNQTPLISNNNNNNNNNMAIAENQVAKLMEEDMGSAMQYLQGKGLCLMPISLATAISTAACTSRNPPPPPPTHLSLDTDDTNSAAQPAAPASAPLNDLSINDGFKK